jgi:hypothetical protein
LVGWGDPIQLLSLRSDDFVVATAIVEKAFELKKSG